MSNRLAIAGIGLMALSICGVLLLVSDVVRGLASAITTAGAVVMFATLWFVVPLARRARLDDAAAPPQ